MAASMATGRRRLAARSIALRRDPERNAVCALARNLRLPFRVEAG
jgi:hypothetical protein